MMLNPISVWTSFSRETVQFPLRGFSLSSSPLSSSPAHLPAWVSSAPHLGSDTLDQAAPPPQADTPLTPTWAVAPHPASPSSLLDALLTLPGSDTACKAALILLCAGIPLWPIVSSLDLAAQTPP